MPLSGISELAATLLFAAGVWLAGAAYIKAMDHLERRRALARRRAPHV